MMSILIGTLLVAIGTGMVYSVIRSLRPEARVRPRMDPAVFATLDLRAPEYRAKSAPPSPFAKLRGEGRAVEPPREPRSEASTGLFTRDREDRIPREGRPSPALRIHGIDPDEDAEQKTLGL
ncbi:MAG: hypothetical protein GHCLOJNM_01882 [bacterium]|nr:hypothetical protein [bacterium]